MANAKMNSGSVLKNANRSPAILIAALLLVAATFLIDIATPRGVAAGIFPHFFAIAITGWIADRRAPLLIAILASLAALTGYAVTEGGHFSIILVNRAVLIAAFWCMAYLVLLKQRADQRLRIANETLEAEIAARTANERLIAERLQLATQTAEIGIWDWNVADDTTDWDERMCEIFDATEEINGDVTRIWKSRTHPNDLARVCRKLADALASRKYFDTAFRLVRKDGSIRHIEGRGLVLRGEDGAAQRVIGVNWDVTERVRTAQRLQQSQKLEAVGQLTSGIAHDFNNLLTIILGNLELLAEESDPGSPQKSLVTSAQKATLRGADLAQRLLAFARVQSLNAEVSDINDVVDKASTLIVRTLGDNIKVEVVQGRDIWPVVIDPSLLENALVNLAINARDAMPDGGILRVETSNIDIPPDDTHASDERKPGPYAVVTVSDTGFGMSQDVAESAFEPFFTTKEIGLGSGLGLSMVYGFVKQSGGHIELNSEPGKGTEFRLCFPKAEDTLQAAPDRPESAPETATPKGNETILVVEDDAEVREFQVRALKPLGYRCIVAEHGPAALAQLDDLANLDLLLTDMIMPRELNGLQLANAVRERFPKVKVLVSSANLDSSGGGSVGNLDFLPKPYTRAALAQAVRKTLDASAKLPPPV